LKEPLTAPEAGEKGVVSTIRQSNHISANQGMDRMLKCLPILSHSEFAIWTAIPKSPQQTTELPRTAGRIRGNTERIGSAKAGRCGTPLEKDTVSQEWIAAKLSMRSAANVSQQLRRYDRTKAYAKLSPAMQGFIQQAWNAES